MESLAIEIRYLIFEYFQFSNICYIIQLTSTSKNWYNMRLSDYSIYSRDFWKRRAESNPFYTHLYLNDGFDNHPCYNLMQKMGYLHYHPKPFPPLSEDELFGFKFEIELRFALIRGQDILFPKRNIGRTCTISRSNIPRLCLNFPSGKCVFKQSIDDSFISITHSDSDDQLMVPVTFAGTIILEEFRARKHQQLSSPHYYCYKCHAYIKNKGKIESHHFTDRHRNNTSKLNLNAH